MVEQHKHKSGLLLELVVLILVVILIHQMVDLQRRLLEDIFCLCYCPGYKQTSYDYNFKFLINGGNSEPVRIIDGGDDLTSHSAFTGTVIYNLNANDYVQVEVIIIYITSILLITSLWVTCWVDTIVG